MNIEKWFKVSRAVCFTFTGLLLYMVLSSIAIYTLPEQQVNAFYFLKITMDINNTLGVPDLIATVLSTIVTLGIYIVKIFKA